MKIWRGRSLWLLSATVLTGIVASSGHCYEIATHATMSGEAAKQSVINKVLPDLGLSSLDDVIQKLTLIDWIREGAIREDDKLSESFLRFRNHFLDPRPDAPNSGGFTGFTIFGFFSGLPAPDWALEPTPISSQIHSFKDARTYFFDALTKSTQVERDSNLALTFRTLGQVIHIVQDMAQPQHTRNDRHVFPPSLFERYTDNIRGNLDFLSGSIPQFNRPRDFFTNDQGTGLAQYTNRSFVSQGTNFGWDGSAATHNATYAFPLALRDPEVASVQDLDVPPAIKDYCGFLSVCNMRFYSSLNDRDEVQPRAATLSIFADDLDQYNINPPNFDQSVRFSLNTLNFKEALPKLIPRAVGYSAGMINYFFRGKIDLARNDSGQSVIQNFGNEAMNGDFALYYDAVDGNRYPVQVDNPADPGNPTFWRLQIAAADAQGNPASSIPVSFTPAPTATPGDPNPNPLSAKKPNEYTLVFAGEMGEERADPTSGVVGAVVAKAVKATYNGQLYVRVTTNQFQARTLRVDRSGTNYVQSGEFDPFAGVEIPQDGSPSYRMKQVVFTQGALGESVHRTIALSAGIWGSFGFTFPKSYALDGPTGFRVINEAGVSWLAKSPDPQIGEFVIGMQPFSRSILDGLGYTRTFQQNGQTQVATGIITLPPQPNFADFDNMDIGGRFFISADGLQYTTGLVGLDGPGVSSTIPLVNGTQLAYRFSFAATPTAALDNSAPAPHSDISITRSNVNDLLGVVQLTRLPCRPDDLPPGPLAVENRHFKIETVTRSNLFERRMIEYQNGSLLTYPKNTHLEVFERDESFGHNLAVYASGCDTWVSTQIRTERTHTRTFNFEALLPEGSFLARTVEPFSVFADNTLNEISTNSYEGPSSGLPPPQVQTFDVNVRTGVSIIRALTPRPDDAFVRPNDGALAGRALFRGIDVTNKRFAVDASPLGEVFFATEDKSTVIHEPRSGGMPVIQLPADVFSILSAIWL